MPTRPPAKKAPARKARLAEGPSEGQAALAEIADRLERIERLASELDRRASTLEERLSVPAPIRVGSASPPGKIAARRQAEVPTQGRAGEVRCPGCSLRTSEPTKRCPYCGFLFSVLPPSRRPGPVPTKKRAAAAPKRRSGKRPG